MIQNGQNFKEAVHSHILEVISECKTRYLFEFLTLVGTPESEEMKSVLASARSKTDLYSLLAGKRVVSDMEWTKLQEEVSICHVILPIT